MNNDCAFHRGMNRAVVGISPRLCESELVGRSVCKGVGRERYRGPRVRSDLMGCPVLVCPGNRCSGFYREACRTEGKIFDRNYV